MKAFRSWLFFVALCLASFFVAVWLRGGTDATPFALLESMLAGTRTSFAELLKSVPKSEETHANNPLTNVEPTQVGALLPPDHATKAALIDHAAQDNLVCGRPRTKSRSDTDAKLIYQWVDQDGQTHMSDTPPDGIIASVLDVGMAKRDFTYNITPDGVSVPADFPGKLAAGSKRIYDTWHFFIGEEKLRQSRIELLLIGGTDRFNAYYARVAPNSKPVNGFYSMGKSQAVVKFDPDESSQALRTTFHEVAHLITASHLGPTPPWLTEGLAEYFETMQVSGQMGTIHPNEAHIKLLRNLPLPSLRDYLNIKRPDWHGEHRSRNYALAWSLMHFLLQGSPGMYALQDVIQQAEANFCKPFSAMDALDGAYPGGLNRLEYDWRKWVFSGQFKVHQT